MGRATEHLENKTECTEYFISQYTKPKRFQEIISVSLFTVLEVWLLCLLVKSLASFPAHLLPGLVGAFFFGIVASDFVSGVVHWMADTWGNLDWPLVGSTFIRSFREHHVNPQAMCLHDVIETNGDNCLVALPPVIFGLFCFQHEEQAQSFMPAFCFSFSLFISLTNQIHGWAHAVKIPAYVRALQWLWIILPRRIHAHHHRGFHDDYYCITNGWLNKILSILHFWRALEVIVSALTGLIPREDDQYWLAKVQRARSLALEQTRAAQSKTFAAEQRAAEAAS
mmetsp:Transcript_20372/g.47628  ORF Transcript_20372/g.47628 Transcript_20372/m.47628 type:complete len:282 (-) Transcript_20372:117-962(-)